MTALDDTHLDNGYLPPDEPPWDDDRHETETRTGVPQMFRRWTMAELLNAPRTFRWLVRGVMVDPTYGQVAGEAKTLKTHVGTFLNVAIASGHPFLDRFTVDRAGPVLKYAGEGGRIADTRLLERVAASLDVDLAALPIHTSYDVAPIQSAIFSESLDRDLRDVAPVLFNLDPYYAFHGAETDSKNLHQEGGLLAGLSARCESVGTTLWITNHFNQTGTGRGLKRITLAAGAEWVDTWMLLEHRETPDVARGRFQLRVDIGSRQWGGTSWDLDLDVGTFDPDLGVHDGAIRWDLRPAGVGGDTPRSRIVAAVTAEPGRHTKEELAKVAGGKLVDARRLVEGVENDGLIWPQLVASKRSDGRSAKAWRYFPRLDPGTTHETDIGASSERDDRPAWDDLS